MLSGIEFGTVRRLFDKCHVVWDFQCPRTMAGGAVQHHRDLFIYMPPGYLCEEDRQRGRVHIGENEGVEFSILRAHCSKGVYVLSNDLAASLGAHPRLTPRTPGIRDASKSSFILKHEPKAAPMQYCLDLPLGDDSGGKRLGTLRGQWHPPWDGVEEEQFFANRAA